jgi:hypothetical protein
MASSLFPTKNSSLLGELSLLEYGLDEVLDLPDIFKPSPTQNKRI